MPLCAGFLESRKSRFIKGRGKIRGKTGKEKKVGDRKGKRKVKGGKSKGVQ